MCVVIESGPRLDFKGLGRLLSVWRVQKGALGAISNGEGFGGCFVAPLRRFKDHPEDLVWSDSLGGRDRVSIGSFQSGRRAERFGKTESFSATF